MDFGTILTTPCVNIPPPRDARCDDPAFAFANPNLCGATQQTKLILKPGTALVCLLGSIQFRAFSVVNGVETDVTASTVFTVSDPNVCVIGASSGNATGIQAGEVTVIGTYNNLTADADLTVIGATNCCDQETVAFMVLVDTSLSMSQAFGGQYPKKLDFAKALATQFINSVNVTKDKVGLLTFNDFDDNVINPPTTDKATVAGNAAAIIQTNRSTSFFDALKTAMDTLAASGADRKVIVLLSDGQDENIDYAVNNPVSLAETFKQISGSFISVGVRASGSGFALLNALATGGFFINAYVGTEADAITLAIGLKGYICGGDCVPTGDEFVATGALNYLGWKNWNGVADLLGNGFVDLLPGNGLYVDLSSASVPYAATLVSKNTFNVSAGKNYTLTMMLAGNQRVDLASNVSVLIKSNSFTYINQTLSIPDYTQGFSQHSFTFTPQTDDVVTITITGAGSSVLTVAGPLLDKISFDNTTDLVNLMTDSFDTENLTYVPPKCGLGTTPYYNGQGGSQVNLVPVMTDYTTPSGTASASDEFGTPPFYRAWMAFDHKIDTLADATQNPPILHSWLTTFVLPQWLQYQFPTAKVIEAYRLSAQVILQGTQTGTPQNYPTDWIFQGSNDGVTWTTLDTQTGVVFDSTHTVKTFTIGSPGSYSYYRITASATSSTHFGLNEMELLATSPGYGFVTGYNCYATGCLNSDPPPAQLQDPSPLPDVEAGFTPPQQFKSTKTACVSCPAGFAAVLTADTSTGGLADPNDPNLTQTLLQQFTVAPIVIGYAIRASHFVAAQQGYVYPFTAILQGSNDGSTWTTLDTQNVAMTYTTALTRSFTLNPQQSYKFFQVIITSQRPSGNPGSYWDGSVLSLYGPASGQVCDTESSVSAISQADADTKATASATAGANAKLQCVQMYSSTQTYTAHCPAGAFGSNVTKSATAISFVSQQDADANALAAAQAAATAALVCDGDNSSQPLTINDNAASTPYPSVQFVSGLTGHITKVTVNVKNFSHASPSDVQMILKSPNGTYVKLMQFCGGPSGSHPVSNLTFVFDDAAGSNLPQSAVLTSGTWKPTTFGATPNLPPPAAAAPYQTALSAFNGETPNGAWSLWVQDTLAIGVGSIAGVPVFAVTITSA